MGRPVVTHADVRKIKAKLWEGDMQVTIAEAFGVSTATVSLICRGKLYHNIEWPDGTVGEMPTQRGIEIQKRRNIEKRSNRSVNTSVLTEEEREELRERLSEEVGDPAEQEADWPECALVLGSGHKLIKKGEKDQKVRKAIQRLVGRLPVGQRTPENVERNFNAVLAEIALP